MRTLLISYSMTGNNDALARGLAKKMGAEHAAIREEKPKNMGAIALDMLFGREPKVRIPEFAVAPEDLIVFVGPVWMGQAASPFRKVFRQLRARIGRYAFVSISGGADGSNPKLAMDLLKRIGKTPAGLVDLHIADLLPPEPKPTRQDTSSYRITEKDVEQLTTEVQAALAKLA